MDNKIKVCYIVSSLCNEGPVNVMYNIIRYMDFSKFEISIITLVPEKAHSRMNDFSALPIAIYQLCKDNKQNLFALYFSLKKKLSGLNPDMVHAHCPRSLYLIAFLPKKYKKIYTIHIYPGLQQHILYGKLKGSLIIWLNHFFTYRIDMPIGCAESVGELYKKNKKRTFKCIPNGCSLPVWPYDENYKQKTKERLGLEKQIRYFIFIGRFSYEKHPEVIIEAFNLLDNKNNTGLIMLGNGPMWDVLKQQNPHILMPGFTTNIYDYLIASDFYISASDVEGLPNTLLESMTVGLPALLSDIPAHREVMSKTVDSGYSLFNNANIANIVSGMSNIISVNDIENKRIKVQNSFQAYYTAEMMSQKYQQVYISLIS